MTSGPLFSVVIPTFNRARLLPDAIDSVLAQRFTDFEVLVVDDGSTDETANVLTCYPSVRSFQQANRGPSVARNRGISEATGEYVAFLDSDDVWSADTLRLHAHAIAEHGRPAIVAGRGAPWHERNAGATRPVEMRHAPTLLDASAVDSPFAGTPGVSIRRDALISCGGFREAMRSGEDQDLFLRLGRASGFVQIISPPLFFQRTGGEQLSEHLAYAVQGIDILITSELQNEYQGGEAFASIRRRAICAAARRVAMMCVHARQARDAMEIYQRCFAWHVALHRWKFLLGFPLAALAARLRA